jgi:organic hydroperoxide reductase OsmC/OhrA
VSTAKRLEYSVSERSGTQARADPGWTAEHLLLSALARCSLASLEYSAKRANVKGSGTAEAEGMVTRRDSDGRFAFVETRVALDVELDPPLEGGALAQLLERAERGCFIGASLAATPTYAWRVNGEQVGSPDGLG